jgi:hypothetical protein
MKSILLRPLFSLVFCASPCFAQRVLLTPVMSSAAPGTSGTFTRTTTHGNSLVVVCLATDRASTLNTPTAAGLTPFVRIHAAAKTAPNLRVGCWRAYTSAPLGSTNIGLSWKKKADWAVFSMEVIGAGKNGPEALGSNCSADNKGMKMEMEMTTEHLSTTVDFRLCAASP